MLLRFKQNLYNKHAAIEFVFNLLFVAKALYENELIFKSDINKKATLSLISSASKSST